jgi:hypothetical protein
MQVIAARKAGYDVSYTDEAFEDDLGVPEAAFGEVGYLFVGGGFARVFGGDIDIGLGLAAGYKEENGAEGGEEIFHIESECEGE